MAGQCCHLDDHSVYNNGPRACIVIWSFTVVTFLVLLVRVWWKRKGKLRLWLGDHLLIASWICLVTPAVLVSISIARGFGKRAIDIDPQYFDGMATRGIGVVMLLSLSSSLSKTALGLQIIQRAGPRTNTVTVGLSIVGINLSMNLEPLLYWVRCMPFHRLWSIIQPDSCWQAEFNYKAAIFTTGFSSLIDLGLVLVLLFFSITPGIRRTQITVTILSVSLGFLASVSALVRLIMYKRSVDMFYDSCILIYWTFSEVGFTIVSASILVTTEMCHFNTQRPLSQGIGIELTNLALTGEEGEHTTSVESSGRPISVGAFDRAGVDPDTVKTGVIIKTQEVRVEHEKRRRMSQKD